MTKMRFGGIMRLNTRYLAFLLVVLLCLLAIAFLAWRAEHTRAQHLESQIQAERRANLSSKKEAEGFPFGIKKSCDPVEAGFEPIGEAARYTLLRASDDANRYVVTGQDADCHFVILLDKSLEHRADEVRVFYDYEQYAFPLPYELHGYQFPQFSDDHFAVAKLASKINQCVENHSLSQEACAVRVQSWLSDNRAYLFIPKDARYSYGDFLLFGDDLYWQGIEIK